MPRIDALAQRPKLDRLAAGSGLAEVEGRSPVEREGGRHQAGLIRGVAVMTRGEALGHGMWIDGTTLQQTADAINAAKLGVKSRFTHPGLSGDGMGKQLGRVSDGALDGDVVRGDLHFGKAAHKTPDGDLADHVMTAAEEDPEAFGLSIAFEHDIDAENAFVEEHGGKVIDTVWGYYDLTDFRSPDPLNTKNLFHVRLKELRGVDAVDEPAANPSGLFHRGQEIPAEADALCAYALGLSDVRPASAVLGIDPERIRGFASRFLSYRGLSLAKDDAMPKPGALSTGSDTTPPPAGETPPAGGEGTKTGAPAAAGDGAKTGDETSGAETPPASGGSGATDAKAEFRAELAKFTALHLVKGAQWFAEGKTFEEASGLAIAELNAEKTGLETKLNAALAAAGGDALEAGSDVGASAPAARQGLTDGQAKFAAAITLPGRK